MVFFVALAHFCLSDRFKGQQIFSVIFPHEFNFAKSTLANHLEQFEVLDGKDTLFVLNVLVICRLNENGEASGLLADFFFGMFFGS